MRFEIFTEIHWWFKMSNIAFVLAQLLYLSSIFQCDQLTKPTIRQTNNGLVEGTEQTTLFGKKYYAFRGLPYAETPITGKDPYTGAEVDRRFRVMKTVNDVTTVVL